MSSETALQIRNISKCFHLYDKPHERLLQTIMRHRKKYYREFWALKDVSFHVNKGETVGIIGRNGSGKSTLLQMICGTLKPTQGVIQTQGRIAALLELGSGFNPEFTGYENVYMNAAILGLSKQEIDNRYDDIIAFADIGHFIDQPVKTYSSGMLLRLAFSVIAHVDADIIVVDEALAVGDAFFTQKCMRFLREFMQKGTVLFVSHDTAGVKNLCNRAIWLEKGRIIEEGSPKVVCEKYLEAFYEIQQGKSSTTQFEQQQLEGPVCFKDQRLDYINQSNLRNDIQIFHFDPNAASFGKGGAQIIDVRLLNQNRDSLVWVVGGEKIILQIKAKAYEDLHLPIIGFHIKDHLGQTLFGDNTFLLYRSNPVMCLKDNIIQGEFVFYMPILPCGEYSVSVAIANGTQDIHEQHHWIHDAIFFKSQSSSVATGLIGIPMQQIKLNIIGTNHESVNSG